MFFNYHTGRIHNDTHPGNFLYHNIKAGGFFHYNIFGVDYYLENIGFLWVIWDFDLSIKATNIVKSKKTMVVKNDYENIIKEYNDADVMLNDLISKFYIWSNFYYFKKPLNKKSLIEYINILPKKLSNTYDNILLNKLPLGAKIINKTPYKINKGNVFK
jgi:hypothetical protein